MRFHQDNRGTRYCDVFPEIDRGDINVTIVQPGAAALWHRHRYQSDYQLVVKGALQIGVCNAPRFLDAKNDLSDFDLSFNDKERKNLVKEWVDEYYEIYIHALYGANLPDGAIENNIIDYVEKYKRESHCNWFYLSDRNAHLGPLFIPAGLWHGCYNFTNEEAILIYHITKMYNTENPDEERCSPEIMGWGYEREAK